MATNVKSKRDESTTKQSISLEFFFRKSIYHKKKLYHNRQIHIELMTTVLIT